MGSQRERGVDEREVGKGLGKVPERLLRIGGDLLAIEPDVVGKRQQRLKILRGTLRVAASGARLYGPEGAGGESSFARRQAILSLCLVAIDETPCTLELLPDMRLGPDEPGIRLTVDVIRLAILTP